MLYNFKKTKGFTILELLVVIAIIGLLTGIINVGLKDTLAKGRDSKRIAEVNGISKALELYRADKENYPLSTLKEDLICIEDPDNNELFSQEMKPYYLPNIPRDPLYPQKVAYSERTHCYYYQSSFNGKEYILFVNLEKVTCSSCHYCGSCNYYTVHSGTSCGELWVGIYTRYDTSCGNPCYAPIFDLSKNGEIDGTDASLLSSHWGDEDWCADKLKDTSNPCQ